MVLTDEQKLRIAEAKKEYHRQWRKKNKDKIRRYNIEYWLKKAQQAAAQQEQAQEARQ